MPRPNKERAKSFTHPAEEAAVMKLSQAPLELRLRVLLVEAGVTRKDLFDHGWNRQRIRAHYLRASFIPVRLALGKSETWVADRTGYKSSVTINCYRRKTRQAEQLNLGPFLPHHEAIPELAALGKPARSWPCQTSPSDGILLAWQPT